MIGDGKYNRLNQSFLFKLFGWQKKYGPDDNFEFILRNDYDYIGSYGQHYTTFPTENEEKHYEPGIPSGIYDVKVYYKDIIFSEIKDFEVSKEKALNGELSSLVFTSPLIDIDGKIVDISGNLLHGDNWSVLINDGDKTIRQYRYAYSLNEAYMLDKLGDETAFKFKNLPLYSCYDIYADLKLQGRIWNDGGYMRFPYDDVDWWDAWRRYEVYSNYLNGTSYSGFREDRALRYAIPSGTFDLVVKYKNKFIKSFTKSFTKEGEAAGEYKNIILEVGEVLKDFNVQFIDNQFGEPAPMIRFNDHLYNSTRDYRAWVRIYDEDYDGDITDDQFNGTNWGTDATENTFTFNKQFVGYYRMRLYCRDVGDNSNTPKILDIIDAETNESIYEKKEETGAQYDLINIGSNLVSSSKTYKVLLDYWFGGLYFAVYKKNYDEEIGIKSNLISIEFEHQNIENLKYSVNSNHSTGSYSNRWAEFRPMKTGKYIGKAYLNFPNGVSYLLAGPTEVNVKQYHDFVFKSKFNTKKIKFAFYGKVGETNSKIYKLPNLRLDRIYFSDELSGSKWEYSYSGFFGESFSGTKTIEIDHLLDGLNLYYSFGTISTYPYTGWSGGANYAAWKGYTSVIKLYKLSNNEYDFNEEQNKLMYSSSLNISDIESSYIDVLENEKFKVEDLEENGTYIALVEQFYVDVTLRVRDSRGNNSSLCYNISIYNEDGSWFSGSSSNEGYLSFSCIPAGRYKIYINYQGIDITPTYLKEDYQDWYTYGTFYIDLEFPLQTFTGYLVYPGKDEVLTNSYMPLAVNVTKLRKLDNTPALVNDSFYDDADEFTYYTVDRYNNSSSASWTYSVSKPTSVWTSDSSNELKLKELMPGLYKIKFFYQYFSRRQLENHDNFGYNPNIKSGYFSKEYGDGSIPSFPTSGFSIPLSSISSMSNVFNEIENLDLVFAYEYNNADGIKRYKYTTGNFELDKTTNPNILIIKKKEGVKTLKEYLQTIDWGSANSKVETSNVMRLSFGDLLKTMYILVNENGIREVDESELSNYDELKDQVEGMNQTTLGQITLPYAYLDRYLIRTRSGYPNVLQYSDLVRMIGITNNITYFNDKFEPYSYSSDRAWEAGERVFPSSASYTYQSPGYFVKSGYEHTFKYVRNNFVFGEVTSYLYTRDQTLYINDLNICSFNGNIINASLNGRRVNHKITWAIYEESDPGNDRLSANNTLYCSGTIDASSSGYFNFPWLLTGERIKLNLSENDPTVVYPSTIKMIDGNLTEDIEIPYEMYTITIEYRDNKNPDSSNLTTMPTSGFTLVRNQGDGFDQTYKFGSGNTASISLKSGKYTGIIFEDTENNIIYKYEDLILDRNLKFTFRMKCERSIVTVKLGSNEYNLNIYDEQRNLFYTIKTVPVDGIIEDIILKNIKYTFARVDTQGNIINEITKKLELQEETIDLTQS